MRVTITTDDGTVFAIHDIGQETAEHLLYRLQDVDPRFGEDRRGEPDHAPGDCLAQELLDDLDSALRQTEAGTFD